MSSDFRSLRATGLLFLVVAACFPSAAVRSRGTGKRIPGIVIAHSPARTRQYIGSPSIAVLPDGTYRASHDLFGPGSTLDRTRVYASADRGLRWKMLSEIEGQWWSTLFVHHGNLFLIGTSRENGYAVIRRSVDGGKNWTTPSDTCSGLLLADGRYHCAPVPVVEHGGRLWRAMEDAMGPDGWGLHFNAFMMSALADSDLLRAANWTFSNRLGRNPEWLDGQFGGWLEGNAVVAPNGGIVNILRVDSPADDEKVAILRVGEGGRTLTFDPQRDFISFPGGAKKFTIRRDPLDGSYWALSNYVPPERRRGQPSRTRNSLALIHSPDLRSWTVKAIVLDHDDAATHGFQYADWQFEGEDIVAVVRTAFDDDETGANNQHDANYLTFHRIEGFRRIR
jgi:hypothetical protein